MSEDSNKNIQHPSLLELLGIKPEEEYDDITNLAAFICDTPFSLLSLISDTTLYFKSQHGLELNETIIENSFCEYAIKSPEELFIVKDARKDERFMNNPMVADEPHIVFYAGMPLMNNEGIVVGTLCVLDIKSRVLEDKQKLALASLARQVLRLFELGVNRLKSQKTTEDLSIVSERLKSVINATGVGTWEWHIPSGTLRVNERWAEIAGYTLKELEPINSDTFLKLIYSDDLPSAAEKVRACRENKTDAFEGEFRLVHKKGHLLWISIKGGVISRSKGGEALIMAGANADIHERKNTDARFKSLANNFPGTFFRYKLYPDGKDELQLVSKGAINIWGYSAEEVMQDSKLAWQRMVEEDIEALQYSIQKSAEELSLWEHEWRYRDGNGKIIWIKGIGNPFRAEDGSTIWDSMILDVTKQKESEIEVHQSEKRFKTLIENSFDVITTFDFDGNTHFITPGSLHFAGYHPEEEVRNINLFDYIHPDDLDMMKKSILRLKNEKRLTAEPYRFRHKDGSWKWVESTIANFLDNPAINALVGNSRDITEKILVENSLRTSEAYYRGLSESQTSYVLRTDLNGNYTYVNKTFKQQFAWVHKDREILGRSCLPTIMEYHHFRVNDIVAKCIAQPEKVFKVELDKPSRDGKVLTTLWDFVCILDSEGNPSEIQCVGLDITSRFQFEKALKESEQRYSDLFHLSPQAKLVYDTNTLKFIDVNQAAIQEYGYSHEEFLKMTIEDIWPNPAISELKGPKTLERRDKQSVLGQFVHKRKNGEEIIVELRTNILMYQGKEVKLVLVNDITERFKYLEAIEAQNERLKSIAWTQSHVVRAPLARIMSLIDVIKDPSTSEGDRVLFLNHVLKSATELDDIIHDIVDSTQLEEKLNSD